MTQAEFWVSEAENEGKGRSGGEVMEDFYDDLAKESKKEEERLYDTDNAFEYLKEVSDMLIDYDPAVVEEDNFPVPVEAVKVLNVDFSGQVMSQKTSLRVLAKATDGELYIYDLWFAYYSGTYLDPPEEDGDIAWIPLKCVIQ